MAKKPKKVVRISITGVTNSNISVSGANLGDHPTIRLEGLHDVDLETPAVLRILELAKLYASEKDPQKKADMQKEVAAICNCSIDQALHLLEINKPA